RLTARCSAAFCSLWETFCSVSCNGLNYSEVQYIFAWIRRRVCWHSVNVKQQLLIKGCSDC
ncbi:hypothetical protein N332_10266, partial [Mesitornis unicolor]